MYVSQAITIDSLDFYLELFIKPVNYVEVKVR